MTKEIHTYFDIKPSNKELKRLEQRGEKPDIEWYLDGKFVGTSKPNAERALQKQLFAEYVAAQKTKGK
jgi:membrane carboxypeptidase/penicillin-binding protein PbpC